MTGAVWTRRTGRARRAIGAAVAAIAVGSSAVVRMPCACAEDADHEAAGSVVIGGGAGEHDRIVVGAAVAVAAREAGWSLPRETMTAKDADRLLQCGEPDTPSACVPPSLGGRIQRIFAFAVDRKQADNGAPMVVLTARLIVAAPRALVVRQRFCEHCADDRLTEASIDLARQLLQDLAVRAGRTVLEVASTPTGARITLDGQPIGATDAAFNTFPGAHVVVVDKPGYRTATRSVIADEGKTCALAVVLVPVAAGAPAPPSRALAAALAGGGALALSAAGVLFDLGARGGPDDKYRYAGATPAGAVLGAAGLAALALAVHQWWQAPQAPALGVTARGGLLAGWSIVF